ncbi:RING-type E3 ubiquitin transferase [Ranunculus cassubicifolius]
MQNSSGQPCDICGDIGISEVIATCSKCHKSREHIYCMHPNLCKLPVSWFCQPCQHHQEEVPNLCRKEDKVWSMGSSKTSDATETLASPSSQAMLIIQEDAHAVSSEKPVDNVLLCQDHATPNSYKFGEEDLPNPPAINALWKGSLKILGSDSDEIYDGVQAYPPAKVLREAYLVSKEMPQVLQFTLQPRADVWTGIFHAGSPSGLDIALYFWPDHLYRESYNRLLELMEKQDLSMVSRLDSKELLIFTSRELPVESQRINMKFYLWGVFHSLEGCHSFVDLKGNQTVVNDSACLDNEVYDQMVDIKINIKGGKKVRNANICLTSNSPDTCRGTSDVPCQDAPNKGIEKVAKYLQATRGEKVLPDYGAPPGFSRRVVLKELPSVEMRGKPQSTDVSADSCGVYEDLANLNENVLHVEDMGIKKAGSKEVGSVDICLTSNSPAACRDTYVSSLDVSNQGNEKVAKHLQAIKREQGDDYGVPPGFSRPILSKERHDSDEMQEKEHPAADVGDCEDSLDLDKNILHREDMVIEEVGSKNVGGDDYGAPGFSRPILSKERHDSVEVQVEEHPAADISEDSVDLDENILHREDMVIEEVGSKKVGGDDYGSPSEFSIPILSKERNDSVEMQEKKHTAADIRGCENSVDLDENILHREAMVIEERGSKKVGGDDYGGAPGFSRPSLSKERYDFVEMQEKQHSADIQSVNCKAHEDSVSLNENFLQVEDVGVEEIGSKEVGSDDYDSPTGFSKPILSKEQCASVEMKEKQDPSDIKSVNCRAFEDSVNLDENIHHIEEMVIEEMGSKEVGGPNICLRSDSKAACWDNLDSSQDGFAKIHSDQPCEKKHTETEECGDVGAPPGLPQLINIKEKQSFCDLKEQHVVDPPLPDSRIAEVSVTFNEELDDPGVEMDIDMAGGKECGIVDICFQRNVVDCPDTLNIPPEKVFPEVHSYQPIITTGQHDDFNAPPEFSKSAHVNGQGVVDIPSISCRIGKESTNVDEVVDDYGMDMEIDMVGGEEVGIIDIRMMCDSTDECSVPWDTPPGVIATIYAGQLTNTVASHLYQTRREQCDAGASGVSKLAINVPTDEGPIATSPVQISCVDHNLDAPSSPAFSNSIKMAEGTSSSKIASNGGKCIVDAQPAIGCLKDLKEQEKVDGLTCMVCKKGYYSKPNDMLGIYSYSEQVNLGTTTNTRSVYTTVSKFNIIHFLCHREAKRTDAYLKNPKKEWKGAILRNDGTLCNSIFPIKSPSVPTLQYVRCVSEYWGNLNKLGCADGSRLQLLTYDLLLMLGRFSTRESFKGGDIERNSRFLPFMIQMGRYLVEQESSSQRQSMSNAISTCLTLYTTQPNHLQVMMVNSLLMESYESWSTHRPAFLKRGIELAHMQHKNKQPLFSEPLAASEKSGAQTNFCSKPMLVYIGLIEQLQRFFKLDVSGDTTSGKVGWEVIMTQKLDNVKELLDYSKKLLVWLDEMMSAKKLKQVFKIMGLSPNMDFGRFSNYGDFVRDAIQGSRKKEQKRKGNENENGSRRKKKKHLQVV